ncbi:hypothetical protein [Halobacillus sp. A5]|uniref:hypothetical protein n=1 Tax=Halobacillus sp. A5 TaxID=2880263 RepID=UPI0020A6472F|nr:hypothetical protein [Halobacillus sp. A5]MCP3029117.1 hypothetical protein [Halobacillus sp. A5]
MTYITILVLIFTVGVTLTILIDSARNGITPTPTTSKEKSAILNISKNMAPQSVADLGAGFGTMAFSLAEQFPDAKVTAYESAIIPWIFLLIRRNVIQRRSNLVIRRKNFMREDLSAYDLFYTYLYPRAMDQLELKLKNHPLTLISNCFTMPHWKPSLIWPVESKTSYGSIYLYRRNLV